MDCDASLLADSPLGKTRYLHLLSGWGPSRKGEATLRALAAYLTSPPARVAGQLEEPDFGLAGTQCPEGRGGGWPPDPRA